MSRHEVSEGRRLRGGVLRAFGSAAGAVVMVVEACAEDARGKCLWAFLRKTESWKEKTETACVVTIDRGAAGS